MDNFIIVAILAVIVGAALAYVIKAKKRGAKCIGCPDSKTCASKSTESDCSGNCGCCCGCGSTEETPENKN